MKHRICKVTSVEFTGPHRLRVGRDPAMLHDWPEYAGALNKWARELDGQTA